MPKDLIKMVALEPLKDSRKVEVKAGQVCYMDKWSARAARDAGRARLADKDPEARAAVTAPGAGAGADGRNPALEPVGALRTGEVPDDDKGGKAKGGADDDDLDDVPDYVSKFASQFKPAEPGTVKDIGGLNADDAIAMVRGAEDVSALMRWFEDEGNEVRGGKKRVTVGRAIQAQIVKLAGPPPKRDQGGTPPAQ